MIKILALNSNMDDLIISYFIIAVGFFVFMNWFVKEVKSRNKHTTIKPFNLDEESDLMNYTFNFNTETTLVKKTSLLTKMILSSVSVVVAIVPFYEFVETLRPEKYIMFMTCFPN
jgi:hypothetical protein